MATRSRSSPNRRREEIHAILVPIRAHGISEFVLLSQPPRPARMMFPLTVERERVNATERSVCRVAELGPVRWRGDGECGHSIFGGGPRDVSPPARAVKAADAKQREASTEEA
ncbi:unnamed protein product [Diplocarpon coronariae]|uniref:Uncharacterized protein n=1 Tax=Diplocarpon coronariae TaxID=2795749 RepID=A0A218YV76_9HELO|nr:hypothetical protein JHW43_007469 [Diplocarpon mali]OWO99697.1 hypothetical protein B2J93_9447 [Marssonina coronariae]